MAEISELVWVLSAVLAAVPIAICYGARWWLDRGSLEPPWSFPIVMLAGGVGGVLFSLYGSPEVQRLIADILGARGRRRLLFIGSVVVPASEELGKAFVLLPFALTPWFRGPVDGLVYGFAAGAGFACAESFMYFAAAWRWPGPTPGSGRSSPGRCPPPSSTGAPRRRWVPFWERRASMAAPSSGCGRQSSGSSRP
ncbi:MAG: PrsW family glutamic-type intramembrane protease [bacterium]